MSKIYASTTPINQKKKLLHKIIAKKEQFAKQNKKAHHPGFNNFPYTFSLFRIVCFHVHCKNVVFEKTKSIKLKAFHIKFKNG